MSPALTATAWEHTLRPYTEAVDPTVALMARMLTDVLNTSTEAAVASIFDQTASTILEAA